MSFLRFSLFALVMSLLMASCGYPDHLQTLPKETVAVVSFDLAGMAAKGDLHKLQEADFYKKMQEKMGEKDAESAKETDEFLKNPLNYGINFLEPVYLFVVKQDSSPSVGLSIALGDEDKFKTFITKMAEEGAAIQPATGYSTLTTTEVSFAWNDNTLIVLPELGFNDAQLFASIFTEKDKEQSVVGQPGFKAYYKNTTDISGWVGLGFLKSMSDLAKAFAPGLAEDADMANVDEQLEKLKDASFQFHVTFKDDEIYTEYITDLPEDLKKAYGEEMLRKGSPDKISNLITGKELGVISASLNLQNYLKAMTDNPALSSETKESISSYVAIVQQFIAPFDGDLLIAVTDVKEIEKTVTEQVPVEEDSTDLTASTEKDLDLEDWDWDMEYRDTTYTKKETLPVFLAATTVNDESFGFLGMMLGKDKPTAGKVKTTDLDGMEIYTTIKDKVLIVGNDKSVVEAISAGTFKGDGSSMIAQGASTHGMYLFANLDLSRYPQVVQDAINNSSADADSKAMLQFFAILDHVEMYNQEDFSAVVSFKLKPKKQNSLYTIIESAGNTAYQLGAFN